MALTKEQTHFKATAPKWMHKLLADFPKLSIMDAAAIFGNLGHESKGLTDDQEDKPVVKGSRGGLNWGQWTGPRRRDFEAYCNRNNLDANSDEAAYAWLFLELKGTEKKAVPALLKVATLDAKTDAFCKTFLRPGIPHNESRRKWAKLALDSYTAAYSGELPEPEQVLGQSKEPATAEAVPAVAPKHGAPGWLPGLLIALLALLIGATVWLTGLDVPQVSDNVSLLGIPEPAPKPFGFSMQELGWQALLIPILLSFLQPVAAAAATWIVGQVGWLWFRFLKTSFDETSAQRLHQALENAILVGFEHFGTSVGRGKLQAFASDYVQTYNPGTVKRLKLTDGKLQELALAHIARLRG